MPESLFNKVTGLGPRACDSIKKETLAQVFSCKFYEIFKNTATLLKKRLWHRFFPVNFTKILRTPFLQNTSG